MRGFINKLRFYLSTTGGMLIYTLLTFAPLCCVLELNFIIDFVIVAVVMLVPVVGTFVELAIWIWSFVVSFSIEFDIFVLIYYIALAFYALKLLAMIAQLVASIGGNVYKKRKIAEAKARKPVEVVPDTSDDDVLPF